VGGGSDGGDTWTRGIEEAEGSCGEHLAALLAATFLLTPPTGIETQGGPDLWFDLSREGGGGMKRAPILPDGTASAAFEIKSMPGPFREWDNGIDRDRARGIDAKGRSLKTPVQATNDVLREASPVLRRARDQLQRKTNAETSRNIFLVIHLFDYFVAESMRPILGPLLDPLPDIEGVDTVWVLWPLEHLTVWSTEQRAWTDLMFNIGGYRRRRVENRGRRCRTPPLARSSESCTPPATTWDAGRWTSTTPSPR
jgi:hypothetical protein